ncbi:family 43 glycosylhydrolase [Pedobacter sp. PF22-3]|uniref:family 43 glycosylhydrolase n=1 Tax=Pedobacter sp. PF22-3 TaxID=2994467 RepID=UPI002246A31B|nr:family 43 glycosylhydrolase [Pedobacter sp. PF22-3]MCX2492739.1 family 43 glycosylhydrolase [Pedobacter sp. PF22-3]
MNKKYLKQFILFLLCSTFQIVLAQSAKEAVLHGNPIIPGYFADPTVKKFGDTYYIYATTDGNGGGFGPAQVWTSKDFVNWTMQDMNWPTTHYYWAPDVTQGADGQYYLYYCQPVEIFGASSHSPVGPWTSLLPKGKPIVSNFMVPNVITLDGQTFKDDDGQYYMYWGTWGIYPNHGCGVGLLNKDMKSFSKLAQIPNTDAKDFFEAPFMFKRKGIYYLTYSSGYCEDGTYRVQYATATNPMGPFKYGTNNPILSTNKDGTVHGPGHQSVLQQRDDFYLVYHRHNNPHNDGGYHRQVAADKMQFDDEGNILKISPTHTGIGYLAKNANPHPNLVRGKKVSASSSYDENFKAEFAFDDNNGTLWKGKSNVGPAWVQVDLGKIFPVKSIHTQFEYATWYYQYKIMYSIDGKTWKIYADRSKNTQHGSPMIDFGNVKARYLRTMVLRTEYPGLNKAIWNIKVFDDAEYHPVMHTKIKKWQPLSVFEPKGLLVDLVLDNLRTGTVIANVPNKGKLGGYFLAGGITKPITTMIGGKKALIFTGQERLASSGPAPQSLLGNSSYSISMWVLNPEIDKEETIVSWTGQGGVNLSNAAAGYGNSKTAGAVTHLGWADLGYKHLPKANEWHLISIVFDGTMERIYVDGELDRSERKMLFINNLKHFLIGGNEDGSAGFSGALASLKIYDIPLSHDEIKAAYKKGLHNSTVLHVEAKNLEYGNLDQWTNNGAALGELIVIDKAEVADVDGKIAVTLGSGEELLLGKELARILDFSKPFSAIFSLYAQVGTKTELFFGRKRARIVGSGKWQQLICTYYKGKFNVFINGKLAVNIDGSNTQKDPHILIGSATEGKSVAISSISVFNYGLDDSGCTQEFDFWKQKLNNNLINASFASKPSAVTPNIVYMAANKPTLPGTNFEYLFKSDEDKNARKWLKSADYTDFTVAPEKRYTYTVKVRDNFGNVTQTSLPCAVTTDSTLFVIRKQNGTALSVPASADGLKGTSWDGLIGNADTVAQHSGVLKLVSHHTFWDGSMAIGPFAYNKVEGDFVAEVVLSDMLGLNQRKAYGANEGGLMVKEPSGTTKLLQNGVMTGWGIGNIVTDFRSGERKQLNNQSGWNFYRHLQIQRQGNLFFMRGSQDGKDWVNLPGSPVKRDDMGRVLQVGVYHATYGDIFGYASFSDFKIIQKK